MKQKFSHIAYTVIAIVLVIGVSRAYALTAPQSNAPAQSEISTPINNSGETQIKKGALITKVDIGAMSDYFPAGRLAEIRDIFPENSTGSNGNNLLDNGDQEVSRYVRGGVVSTNSFLVSPWGFFTQLISSSVTVGDTSSQSDSMPTVSEPVSGDLQPMKLDLSGRGTANNSITGTQAISILAGISGNMCNTYTTIIVNKPQIGFNSSINSGKADVLARQVRLTAGNPKQNSVLIQSSGKSTWATLTVVNDQIVLTPNS